ncbi:unnamed protein product [Spodoptera littoralis]|uniref:ZAD domain-containing protein n=1 Tax=Spodoptera littoralis TaxID=7109 RepID=A0A9P0N185_SPOLI|nr:unnamed protein product [Spodoptera littoralis]CAH1636172.1 unnamed protein product [Spodoptera littoralis]
MAAEQNIWSENKKICRICLHIDPRALDMFKSYYEERDTLYCDMLAYCSKVMVNMKDGLPPYLCRNCIAHLIDAYEFNLECEETEKNFHWLLTILD